MPLDGSATRPTPANLEELRELASQYGLPMHVVDRLALRPREVAQTTGFSLRSVERWIRIGKLPAIRVERATAVPLQDLLRFLDHHRIAPVKALTPASPLRDRALSLIEGGSRQ